VLPLIDVAAGKFLGVQRIFARIFPNVPEKFWATFCANSFSWRPFSGWLPKKIFMWFCTPCDPFLSYQSTLGAILPVFSGSLPRFSVSLRRFSQILLEFWANQNFWGSACTPASYTTATTARRPTVLSNSIFQARWWPSLWSLKVKCSILWLTRSSQCFNKNNKRASSLCVFQSTYASNWR